MPRPILCNLIHCSPQLTTSPVAIGKLKDELQLSYDYQKRVGEWERAGKHNFEMVGSSYE